MSSEQLKNELDKAPNLSQELETQLSSFIDKRTSEVGPEQQEKVREGLQREIGALVDYTKRLGTDFSFNPERIADNLKNAEPKKPRWMLSASILSKGERSPVGIGRREGKNGRALTSIDDFPLVDATNPTTERVATFGVPTKVAFAESLSLFTEDEAGSLKEALSKATKPAEQEKIFDDAIRTAATAKGIAVDELGKDGYVIDFPILNQSGVTARFIKGSINDPGFYKAKDGVLYDGDIRIVSLNFGESAVTQLANEAATEKARLVEEKKKSEPPITAFETAPAPKEKSKIQSRIEDGEIVTRGIQEQAMLRLQNTAALAMEITGASRHNELSLKASQDWRSGLARPNITEAGYIKEYSSQELGRVGAEVAADAGRWQSDISRAVSRLSDMVARARSSLGAQGRGRELMNDEVVLDEMRKKELLDGQEPLVLLAAQIGSTANPEQLVSRPAIAAHDLQRPVVLRPEQEALRAESIKRAPTGLPSQVALLTELGVLSKEAAEKITTQKAFDETLAAIAGAGGTAEQYRAELKTNVPGLTIEVLHGKLGEPGLPPVSDTYGNASFRSITAKLAPSFIRPTV